MGGDDWWIDFSLTKQVSFCSRFSLVGLCKYNLQVIGIGVCLLEWVEAMVKGSRAIVRAFPFIRIFANLCQDNFPKRIKV